VPRAVVWSVGGYCKIPAPPNHMARPYGTYNTPYGHLSDWHAYPHDCLKFAITMQM
jgi:hypothetical protein